MRADGIRVRARAGGFGHRSWSRRWYADLERSAGTRARLDGRVDARNGRVLALEHSGATVRAHVRGSRPDPFEVRFRFARVPESEYAALRAAIELMDDPDLPEEGLLGALAGRFSDRVGFRLLPAVGDEATVTCSCPESGVCRHVVAAAAVMVEWWDREPGVLFTLRGVGPAHLGVVDGASGEGSAKGALVDPWGPVGRLPTVPVLPPSGVLDLLDGPVARRFAAATGSDPLEHLRVLSDLEDLYHVLLGGTDLS